MHEREGLYLKDNRNRYCTKFLTKERFKSTFCVINSLKTLLLVVKYKN